MVAAACCCWLVLASHGCTHTHWTCCLPCLPCHRRCHSPAVCVATVHPCPHARTQAYLYKPGSVQACARVSPAAGCLAKCSPGSLQRLECKLAPGPLVLRLLVWDSSGAAFCRALSTPLVSGGRSPGGVGVGLWLPGPVSPASPAWSSHEAKVCLPWRHPGPSLPACRVSLPACSCPQSTHSSL